MIKIQNISKKYGETEALKNINLEISEGELFGLIGPNGAGKTTLFRILTSLLLADSGTATIDGLDAVKDYKELRRRIGYMPGRFSGFGEFVCESPTVNNFAFELFEHLNI